MEIAIPALAILFVFLWLILLAGFDVAKQHPVPKRSAHKTRWRIGGPQIGGTE